MVTNLELLTKNRNSEGFFKSTQKSKKQPLLFDHGHLYLLYTISITFNQKLRRAWYQKSMQKGALNFLNPNYPEYNEDICSWNICDSLKKNKTMFEGSIVQGMQSLDIFHSIALVKLLFVLTENQSEWCTKYWLTDLDPLKILKFPRVNGQKTS